MTENVKEYEVRVIWDPNKGGQVQVEGKPTIMVVKPQGYEGDPELFTPEDLFVSAATVCFMNSFIYFTQRMHIEFKSFECEAVGTLEMVDRSFEVTRIVQKAKVVIESEELRPKISRALELGAKYCFIANSMKTDVTHEDEIVIG